MICDGNICNKQSMIFITAVVIKVYILTVLISTLVLQ